MGLKRLYRQMTGAARWGSRSEREAAVYLSPEHIAGGEGGSFDVRSLLAWCEIARLAAVPTVPALPWVTLDESLIDRLLSGQVMDDETDALNAVGAQATDTLKTGYIVRHDHAGSERLKIQAAIGEPPSDGLDPIGWVRIGNYAFPDVTDRRTVNAIVESGAGLGGSFPQTFVQRPWIATARRRGIDPHREGAGVEGEWPREWRVFIFDSDVAAVSNYYIQTPATGGIRDTVAVEQVTDAAIEMLTVLGERRLVPACPMLSHLQRAARPIRDKMPPGSINCTLDFIESADGDMLFLEGGPPYTPPPWRWGGHPCCFLGREWPKGVAYRLDDGVHPMWQGVGAKDSA